MSGDFSHALRIAANTHTGLDKGGKPYILHPIRIAMRLRTDDIERMIIAILHDVVEDSKITFDNLLQEGFSERVVDALRLLTHYPGESYDVYIDKMKDNIDALLVKREDLRDNSDILRLKGVTDKDVARMVKYQKAFLKVEQYISDIQSKK